MRGSSLCSVRVPGRNNRKNEEALFKDTMAENFPNGGKIAILTSRWVLLEIFPETSQ